MRVVVSGASGLVGRALVRALLQKNHEVLRLVRREAAGPDEVTWIPEAGTIDASRLEGADAVVHLAGENIASGRWTPKVKGRIRSSRVRGTATLARGVAGLARKPATWIGASAIGYYGSQGDQILTEDSPPGRGFLAGVCREWEEAARPALDAGIGVTILRIGVVLSPEGGALRQMLTPFRLGLGGVIGSGNQYMSWIDKDDLVSILLFALERVDCQGVVNAVAPVPVTNQEFTKALGKVLGRPTVLPLPAFAARMVMGEMADELLLASTRVVPTRLEKLGFRFAYPEIGASLAHQLGQG